MTAVLIVGGNGFLGSHLVDRLAADGHEVVVYDRFSTPAPRYATTGVRAIVGDLADVDALGAAMRGVEQVFHFVSPSTPATADSDPLVDLRFGLPHSVALLQAAVDAGVSRVVYASSGGTIYGDQPIPAYRETDAPAPVSPYGIGKLAVEGYLRYFRRSYGLDTIALRIANPYSVRQQGAHGQGFIAIALHAAREGMPVLVYGDGSMVRDYVHADDVVASIAAMVDRPHQHEVYNLGGGRGVTVTELLALIERVTGATLRVTRSEVPRSFVERSVLDITRVVDEYGIRPVTTLEEGITAIWRQRGGQA